MDHVAHNLAESINPLFVLLLFAAPFIGPRPFERRRLLPFWLSAGVGLAVGVLLAEEGKRLPIWPGHPTFPSGHETFALACATGLVCWDRRWAWAAVPLALVMGWALVTARYHLPIDVLGALLTGVLPALLAQSWRLRRITP